MANPIVRITAAQGVPGAVGEAGIGSATVLANASIPTSGSVALSITPNFFLNDGGQVLGNIRGIDGTLARSGGVYTFTPTTNPGSAVPLTAGVDSFHPIRGINLSFIVPTIAALKARTVTLSEKVQVVDYAVANDGGGGTFFADLADTTSVDNGGTIIVGNSGIRWKRINDDGSVSVRCFGARGDGITDDTVAVQKAINACQAQGKKLRLPMGNYITSSTILIRAVGLIMEGQTRANAGDGEDTVTRLTWIGTDPNAPMFRCANASTCLFQHILFYNFTPLLAYFLVLAEIAFLDSGQGWISSANNWEKCVFGSPRTQNKAQYCVLFSGDPARGSRDANNDLHRFVDCSLMGYSEAGIGCEKATQLHDVLIIGSNFLGLISDGKHAVYMDGGFFTVLGGSGGYHKVSDFSIGNPSGPICIRNWNCEDSFRLIEQRGFSSNGQCLLIEGTRYQAPDGIAPDGFFIKLACPMPLSLRNCYIIGNGLAIPRIRLDAPTSVDSGSAEIVCNDFIYNDDYTNQPILKDHVFIGQGNWAITYFGNQTTLPVTVRHDNYYTKITSIETKNTLIAGNHTLTETGKTLNIDSRHTYEHGFEVTEFGTAIAGSVVLPGATVRSRLISFTEFPPCTDAWGNGFNIQGCAMVQASGAGTVADSSHVFIKLARLGVAFASYVKVSLGLFVSGSISILGFLNDGYVTTEPSHASFSHGVQNQNSGLLATNFNTAASRPIVTTQEFKLELALIEDATYTHLCLKVTGRTTNAAFRACNITFNLNYAGVQL